VPSPTMGILQREDEGLQTDLHHNSVSAGHRGGFLAAFDPDSLSITLPLIVA
jgi:hypothetical protein